MANRNVFSAWDLKPLTLSEFGALNPTLEQPISLAQAHYLLEFSLLAPSAHNSVPQAYGLELGQGRVCVFLRPRHILEASDPSAREAMISVGCAIENVVRAAAQYGIQCRWLGEPELTWSPLVPSSRASEVLVGRLQLTSGAECPDERTRRAALAGLLQRKVVRAEYDRTLLLPRQLVSLLKACVEPSERVRLELFETDTEKFAWGKLDELAIKHKLDERAFQLELGNWLLPNDDDVSSRGMRGREFGLDDLMTQTLGAQLRGDAPMAADQTAFMARGGRLGLASASAVCVLSCLDESPDSAIAAGRVYQRCALSCWAHGIAHAVHTAVCKVPHVRAISQATLLRSRLAPTAMFRLGRPLHDADWERPHSSRPALSELLVTDVPTSSFGAHPHTVHTVA